MLNALTWHRLRDTRIAEEVEALRDDTLRMILWLSVGGYVVWHSISTATTAPNTAVHSWLLFPIVVAGLTLTFLLSRRQSPIAAVCFSITSILSITSAIWIFQSPLPILLCPFVVLTTVFLLDPVGGLATAGGSFLLLYALWRFGPLAFLETDQLVETAIASLLAVVISWALGRNTIVAVEWALSSYNQAVQNAEAARGHRAELVQALKQLDNAYYRLERANIALELAWKAADNAERAKSEFVTNISHELRTPLNLIVGFSELIVTSPESYEVPLPAAYCGDINAIYRSAQHLLNLTEDVLDLARVGIGRLSLLREPMDLQQAICDACDIIRGYATAKGLWLHVEAPDGLPMVYADRLRIRQILLNLLTNAARFTDEGGITVSISIKEDQSVVVTVADTGRGIEAHAASKIFDPYYQVESNGLERKERFEGAGLGLPLSKRLVELHGGQMGVESAVRKGTRLWFTLPISMIDDVDPSDGSTGEPGHSLGFASVTGDTTRILVIAGLDNGLSDLLQRHLHGFQLALEPDPHQAVQRAVDLRAMAILADTNTASLLCREAAPVPIVTLPLLHPERLATSLGVTAYLVKPVTRSKLHKVVTQLNRPVRTALVVDDDPRFARLMVRFLRSCIRDERIDVHLAQNGSDALRLLHATHPDLVLLDLIMPDLSGRDVLAAMAAVPSLVDVPVIIVSAQEDQQMLLDGPLAVTKPDGFQCEEMISAVESILGAMSPPRQYLLAPSHK